VLRLFPRGFGVAFPVLIRCGRLGHPQGVPV
jgi:hypothetical protein